MKTRDKIIQASIELFNEHGERNVTTNHIAAHLGISPGNLYYHFRNKEDIILSIYSEYAEHTLASFPPISPSAKPLDATIKYMDSAFQLMSKFRFFYSNLPILFSKNPTLHQKYVDVQAAITNKIDDLLLSLREANIVNFANDDLDDLTSLLRFVTTYWLSFYQTNSINAPIGPAAFYEGLLKILTLLQPYITEEALDEFKQAKALYKQRHKEALAQ